MSIPLAENIPLITFNYEGLKRHSFIGLMFRDVQLSDEERKFRSWLLHMMVISARQYTISRELVFKQNTTDQIKEGGLILYVLEVSEHLENCVSSLSKACIAIQNSVNKNEKYEMFFNKNKEIIEELRKIRNQFEHMHTQIVAGETGKGPLFISFSDSGKKIQFRKLVLETESFYILIHDLYRLVSSMYPKFDPDSEQIAGGPGKLIIKADVKIEKNLQQKLS